MTVCLSVCSQDYANTIGLELHKILEDGSWSDLDPINFETDLDYHLNTKINLNFPIY